MRYNPPHLSFLWHVSSGSRAQWRYDPLRRKRKSYTCLLVPSDGSKVESCSTPAFYIQNIFDLYVQHIYVVCPVYITFMEAI